MDYNNNYRGNSHYEAYYRQLYNHEENTTQFRKTNEDLINFEKLICENIRGKYKKVRARFRLSAFFIPLCIIIFIGGVLIPLFTKSYFVIFAIIGFIGLLTAIVNSILLSTKRDNIKIIIKTIDEICGKDCSYISELFLAKLIGENKILKIIKKLIETRNIENYEIVGDIAVAKTELRLKKEDLKPTKKNVPPDIEAIEDELKEKREQVENAYKNYNNSSQNE